MSTELSKWWFSLCKAFKGNFFFSQIGMMVVLPIFRSCYTLEVQFMSLLISLGTLPMLNEEDIGAESCHIDLRGGKRTANLKTLKFPLMCGQEQVSHDTDIRVCFISETFTSYKVINKFQPLAILIFLCPCHPLSPSKRKSSAVLQ